MPPPNLGYTRYTLPKVAILRSLATIRLFHRFPSKPCTYHSTPTLENNNLPVGPPKPGNLPSIAHLSLTAHRTSQNHLFWPLELKQPDHSGDVKQFGTPKITFSLGFSATAHTFPLPSQLTTYWPDPRDCAPLHINCPTAPRPARPTAHSAPPLHNRTRQSRCLDRVALGFIGGGDSLSLGSALGPRVTIPRVTGADP
ncbi:hypothetical protein C8J57DRAFT_1226413 [Mycena rebaudengoi]|nr:hypothetical protein C8J57DRAFT_1226413 [Mycena rebaudengoi]